MTAQEKLKHLYNRAGFGISIAHWQGHVHISKAVRHLLHPKMLHPLEVTNKEDWQSSNMKVLKMMEISVEERKARQKLFREKGAELNMDWLRQMIGEENPLNEKMALFWHGHFATHTDNPYFDQLLLQQIRTNALGNFGDMLRAVAQSPAMLQFLNNQQNKKQHPNENFARELMELFTLGRGHYTETDIKEAAKAFTGWSFNEDGHFELKEKQHDNTSKTFLGKTGNFDGNAVLDILLEQKQTAIFITQKIYRYFVNEESVDAQRVQLLAQDFYTSNYNIRSLMYAILSSDWFYDPNNIGAHVKSPIELLVGMNRTIIMDFKSDKTLINLQRVLGQQLFAPPNVAGWSGGRNWIDASSLVIRMQLSEAFFASKELHLEAKEPLDSEVTIEHKMQAHKKAQGERFKVGQVDADWADYLAFWTSYDEKELPRQLADYLLPVPISDESLANLYAFIDTTNKQTLIQSLTIRLMGLPEYQLC
jgi:uncharacterized protein (DUF1800 family)